MMVEDKDLTKTGTTTLGLVCKEGVVLAADKRATSGYLVSYKKFDKIINIIDIILVCACCEIDLILYACLHVVNLVTKSAGWPRNKKLWSFSPNTVLAMKTSNAYSIPLR